METTAHAQSHLRRHGCLAYLTQAFIPASFGDMLWSAGLCRIRPPWLIPRSI